MKILKEQIMTSDLNLLLIGSGNSDPVLVQDIVISINNNMTTAEIQTLIDSQPKNLGGYILTFQFTDGTYTLNNVLLFKSFYNGTVNILGNVTNNTASASKAVMLNFTNGNYSGIHLFESSAIFNIMYLDVFLNNNGNIDGNGVVRVEKCSGYTQTEYNYLHTDINLVTGTLFIRGFYAIKSVNNRVAYNYFGGGGYACIQATEQSIIFSMINYSTGNKALRGLTATNGVIMKYDSQQPIGSDTIEHTLWGGVIR